MLESALRKCGSQFWNSGSLLALPCWRYWCLLVVMLKPTSPEAPSTPAEAGVHCRCLQCVVFAPFMRAHSRSNQRSTPQGQQQVWLPGLQVWAALGSRADRPYTSSTTQAATVLRADRTPLAQPKMPSTSTAVSLPVQTSPKAGPKATNATAQAAGDTHESLPHCPICEHSLGRHRIGTSGIPCADHLPVA